MFKDRVFEYNKYKRNDLIKLITTNKNQSMFLLLAQGLQDILNLPEIGLLLSLFMEERISQR